MNDDTPRTNAHAVWPASNDDSDRESPDGSHVPADFARELERENARLREAARALYNYECVPGAKHAGEYERLFESLRVAIMPNGKTSETAET